MSVIEIPILKLRPVFYILLGVAAHYREIEYPRIVGPSGAGKSTFLNLISGFASISSGTITWNGEEISNLPPAKRSVSILFQDNNLFPHLSVWRNLALAVTHWPKISRDHEEKLKALRTT